MLDRVVVQSDVPHRVWYHGAMRDSVWLVKPDGVMRLFAAAAVAAMPVAPAALAAKAFPAVH